MHHSTNRTVTLYLVVLLVIWPIGVAGVVPTVATAANQPALSIDVTQHDDFTATVTVTENGSAAAGANVTVEPVDSNATYGGSGQYVTDENGTAGLPAPEDDVLVDIAARYNNSTASTTTMLEAAEAPPNNTTFGSLVTTFIGDYRADNNTSQPLGLALASFVVANNPGKAPAHAGPPTDHPHSGNGNLNLNSGPPNGTPGPPNGTLGAANRTPGASDNSSGGPPDDAGSPNTNGNDNGDRGNGNGKGGNAAEPKGQ